MQMPNQLQFKTATKWQIFEIHHTLEIDQHHENPTENLCNSNKVCMHVCVRAMLICTKSLMFH